MIPFVAPYFYQAAPSANIVAAAETGNLKAAEVESALRQFMGSIPSLEFSRQNLVSQAGPIKPERLIRPKSIIPAPPNSIPVQNPELPSVTVIADRQDFNAKEQIFTASGNVTVKYLDTELKADVVKLNLISKDATAEGKVFLQRGEQKIKGEVLSYNYQSKKGSLTVASGFINISNLGASRVSRQPADVGSKSAIINLSGNSNTSPSQDISRIRFRAEKIILDSDFWAAENLTITNDPFDPPELELRATKATLTRINPTQDRLDAESGSLAFDQSLVLPIPFSSIILDRFERTLPVRIGFDQRDSGGFFYQQNINAYSKPDINFQISPQFFLQRSFQGNLLDANVLGFAAKLDAILPDAQFFSGRATLSGLNFANAENQLRANLEYSRPVFGDHVLVAQYAFRDRIFNGSLGFQDVNNSIGVNIFSPNRILGDSDINFSYQFGAQYIGAGRDLGGGQPIDIASLLRLQGATSLSRSFSLWRGTVLPAERELGLKYQAEPVVPGLDAVVGVSANYAFYSSGESQGFLSGTLGLVGTFGNFSKPFLDYTKINISYTQGLVVGRSPFLFDRVADAQTITFGLVQQVYGPFRVGAEQSLNPATGRIVDSNYSLQYDRRTYAIVIRYNPTREIGEVIFRISDFNFSGSDDNVTPVTGGLERR